MINTNGSAGVLFDLDGTLLHTAPDLGATANQILQDHNLPLLSDEIINQTASHGAAGMLRAGFGQSLGGIQLTELIQRFFADYEALDHRQTQLFDGIGEAIEYLDNQKIPWGIVTNKPIHLTIPLVAKFPQLTNCGCLIGGDSLPKRKPDPMPLQHACEQIRIKAEASLYIGDAQRDIEAGRNANMRTVLAQWGYLAKSDPITEWGADTHCQQSQQLKSLLQRWLAID